MSDVRVKSALSQVWPAILAVLFMAGLTVYLYTAVNSSTNTCGWVSCPGWPTSFSPLVNKEDR